jgi:hypothetical protein
MVTAPTSGRANSTTPDAAGTKPPTIKPYRDQYTPEPA